MKNLFSLTFLMVLAVLAVAQVNSGKILYDEIIKLNIVIDDNNGPNNTMPDIPKEHISKKVLLFTTEASLYKGAEAKTGETKKETTEGGMQMTLKVDEPDDRSFCDIANGKLIEQREFMTRKFLVTSEMNTQQWKLTGSQKEILGYACQEATLDLYNHHFTAWFAPSISVSTGPAGYGNLPGLILALDMDNGKRVIAAKQIIPGDVDKSLFLIPKDGKKVTKDEFVKIVEQKQKEMREENGGDGNVIIKIRN